MWWTVRRAWRRTRANGPTLLLHLRFCPRRCQTLYGFRSYHTLFGFRSHDKWFRLRTAKLWFELLFDQGHCLGWNRPLLDRQLRWFGR